MKRRNFIKYSGTALAASFFAGKTFGALTNSQLPDLVVAKGGSAFKIAELAAAAFNGYQSIIKPGATVLIKPTILWDKTSSQAFNTNPLLTKRVIIDSSTAKAQKIFVIENSIDNWTKCYKNSGIELASKAIMARVLPPDDLRQYLDVEFPFGSVKIHELYKEADVVVNVPAAAIFEGLGYFGAVHNLAGITHNVRFSETPSPNFYTNLMQFRKPELTIIDGVNVVEPTGIRKLNTVVASYDPVAADSMMCQLLGIDPETVAPIVNAHQSGLGNMNTDELRVRYIDASY